MEKDAIQNLYFTTTLNPPPKQEPVREEKKLKTRSINMLPELPRR